jgi:hypothetical protein
VTGRELGVPGRNVVIPAPIEEDQPASTPLRYLPSLGSGTVLSEVIAVVDGTNERTSGAVASRADLHARRFPFPSKLAKSDASPAGPRVNYHNFAGWLEVYGRVATGTLARSTESIDSC